VLEGSFLQSAGVTFFVPGMIDKLGGTATFNADTLLALVPGAVGSGDLVTLSFHATATGISAVTLSNVVLLDSELNDIAFIARSGSVAVASVPEAVLLRCWYSSFSVVGWLSGPGIECVNVFLPCCVLGLAAVRGSVLSTCWL
jgi:hypothetical protein